MRKTSVILLAVAALLLLLFDTCSPLYPFNPWCDANWFITIGKGLWSGLMPYRDLFDQKGPALFLLHGLMTGISDTSFTGVYLVQVVCWWATMLYGYKTMRLFSDSPVCLPLMCAITCLCLTSDFYFWGNSVEEYCLPFMAYTQYHMLRLGLKGEAPGGWRCFIMGLGLGFVFWSKYTILTFYFGALIALLLHCCRKEQMSLFVRITGQVLLGWLAVTLAVFAFAACNGIVADMLDAYFITNLFKYGAMRAEGGQALPVVRMAKLLGGILLTYIPYRLIRNRDIRMFVILPWAFTMAFFSIATIFPYYFIASFYFLPLLIYFFRKLRPTWKVYTPLALACLLAAMLNLNICLLLTGNFPKAILPIAEIVNSDPERGRQLLTYNSKDTGIYLLSDCTSPNRYFSVPEAQVEDVDLVQQADLTSCRCKYVICKAELNRGNEHDMDGNTDYTLVCETSENFRYVFLGTPLLYLWTLGYTQPLMESWYTPEIDNVYRYRLYRLSETRQ